jgi:hypothetical protein
VATTHDDFDLVVLRVPGLELQGENPRSNPRWLYLAMTMFLRRYLVEGIARICLDLIFKVKTYDLAFVVGSGHGGA